MNNFYMLVSIKCYLVIIMRIFKVDLYEYFGAERQKGCAGYLKCYLLENSEPKKDKCPKCGQDLRPEAMFCDKCGNKINNLN